MVNYKLMVMGQCKDGKIAGLIGNLKARDDDDAALKTFKFWMDRTLYSPAEDVRVKLMRDGHTLMSINNGAVEVSPLNWDTEQFEDCYIERATIR